MEAEARRRFARQLSLAEVGEGGQARLCAHVVRVEGDPRAAGIAAEYLARAGVQVSRADAAATLDVGAEGDVAALAGAPELEQAAAFALGAFAAVEEIKRALGVGRPGRLHGVSLSAAEDA